MRRRAAACSLERPLPRTRDGQVWKVGDDREGGRVAGCPAAPHAGRSLNADIAPASAVAHLPDRGLRWWGTG